MPGITKEMLIKRAIAVRTGGKGTPRRKSKGVHRNAGGDDRKLQDTLRKLDVTNIGDIEEVTFLREDNTVLKFSNPRVEANLTAHTYVIRGER